MFSILIWLLSIAFKCTLLQVPSGTVPGISQSAGSSTHPSGRNCFTKFLLLPLYASLRCPSVLLFPVFYRSQYKAWEINLGMMLQLRHIQNSLSTQQAWPELYHYVNMKPVDPVHDPIDYHSCCHAENA